MAGSCRNPLVSGRSARGLLAALALALAAPDPALAGCNIIGFAARELPSNDGFVDRPVAGPGDFVTIRADLACNPGKAGFGLPGNANQVELIFGDADLGIPESSFAVPASHVSVKPESCGELRCEVLLVEIPDTSSAEVPGGLTGPAVIRVTRPGLNTPVAVISNLFQPSTACVPAGIDASQVYAPEATFRRFTVLAAPNVLPAAPAPVPSGDFAAAVDGSGAALVRFDFRNVLQAPAGAPTATVLKLGSVSAGILNALDVDSGALSSYNLFGRRIPPLLRLVAEPTGFPGFIGTTDVLESLFRVEPLPAPNPAYTTLMGSGGVGPLQLPGGTLSIQSATPLAALRTSLLAVGAGADESRGQVGDRNLDGDQADLVVEVTDVVTGESTDTGKALTVARNSGAKPVLVTREGLVAFLRSEARDGGLDFNDDGDVMDNRIEIHDATGADRGLDGESLAAFADARARVNDRPLVLSGDGVDDYLFYLSNPGEAGLRRTRTVSSFGGLNSDFFGEGSEEGNDDSNAASISADGRRVAFESRAGNLVDGGGFNSNPQVFFYDAGRTEQVSSFQGIFEDSAAFEGSFAPAISPDGNFVAFQSATSEYTGEETGGNLQVMLWDRLNGGEITLASTSAVSSASGGNANSTQSSVCENAAVIAFASTASDLALPDPNGVSDVFVRRRDESTPALVSLGFGGVPANGPSTEPAISADCRYVAFSSDATNLGAPGEDSGLFGDVFVADLESGGIERISVAFDGGEANGPARTPSISRDGRYVAWESPADNVVPGGGDIDGAIYVRDRQEGKTTRVDQSVEGVPANGPCASPSISGDGRYVAFSCASTVTTLVPDDTNFDADVFRVDRVTGAIERLSLRDDGDEANDSSFEPHLSHDGHTAVFVSHASNLSNSPSDSGEYRDVFRRTSTGAADPSTLEVVTVGSPSSVASVAKAEKVAVSGGRAVLLSPAPRIAPRVYLADDVGSLAAIDVEENSIVNEGGGLGEDVRDLAVSPDGRELWLADSGSNAVLVYDASSFGLLTVLGGGFDFDSPRGVAFTPDGSQGWVSNREFVDEVEIAGFVQRIDTASRTLIARLSSSCMEEPGSIVMSASTGRAYVLDKGNGPFFGGPPGVCVFDIATQALVARIDFDQGAFPEEAIELPGAGALFVSIPSSDAVLRIDTATNAVTSTISLLPDFSTGEPRGLALSRDGSRLYVSRNSAAESSFRIGVIDTATNAVLSSLSLDTRSGTASNSVFGLARVPGSDLIYASLPGAGEAAVINGATGNQVYSQQQFELSSAGFVAAAGEVPSDATVAQYYDQGTGSLTSLGVNAVDAAISDQVVCLAADTPAKDLLVWTIGDFTGPGGTPNVIDSGIDGAVQIGALGRRCIVRSTGGSLGGPLRVYDSLTASVTGPGIGAIDFQIAPGSTLVAHRTCEGPNESDFNGDGDESDCVMHAWDVLAESGLNTQLAAIPCDGFDACETFELYTVRGSLADGQLSFLGRETDQAINGVGCLPKLSSGCDLDGDGRGDGVVVHVVKLGGGDVAARQAFPASAGAQAGFFPETVVGQSVLTVTSTECSEALRECCTALLNEPICSADPLGETFLYAPGSCTSRFDTDADGDSSIATDLPGRLDCVTERTWLVPDADGDGVQDVAGNGVNDNCSAANPDQLDMDEDGLGDLGGCDPNAASPRPGDLDCDLDGSGHIDRLDVDLIFDAVGRPAIGSPRLGWDRRDRNQSGKITTLDAAFCTDACECEGCATSCEAGGGGAAAAAASCGLLGAEALLPIGLLLAARRRRRHRA